MLIVLCKICAKFTTLRQHENQLVFTTDPNNNRKRSEKFY